MLRPCLVLQCSIWSFGGSNRCALGCVSTQYILSFMSLIAMNFWSSFSTDGVRPFSAPRYTHLLLAVDASVRVALDARSAKTGNTIKSRGPQEWRCQREKGEGHSCLILQPFRTYSLLYLQNSVLQLGIKYTGSLELVVASVTRAFELIRRKNPIPTRRYR